MPNRVYGARERIVQSAFTPATVSAVSAWLRLQNSSQSGGLWTNWVDVLNSNPATQSDTDRQPTVAAAANDFPIATYDGSSDCGPLWPLAASNNGETAWGMMLWIRPASVGTNNKRIAVIWDSGSAASVSKLLFQHDQQTVHFFGVSSAGALFDRVSSNVLSANVWHCIGVEYNGAGTPSCVLTLDGVAISSTLTGTIPASLRTGVTGSLIFGAFSNSDTPSDPFVGSFGPNCFVFNAPMAGVTSGLLTPEARLALANFEPPT